MPGMPIHSNALIVTEDLRNKVVAWATEIASYARRSFRQRHSSSLQISR